MEDREPRVIQFDDEPVAAGPTGPLQFAVVENYTAQVHCENCEYQGEAQIPKGTLVGNGTCPNCGCNSIRKFIQPMAPGVATTGTISTGPRLPPGTQFQDLDLGSTHIHTFLPPRSMEDGSQVINFMNETLTGMPEDRQQALFSRLTPEACRAALSGGTPLQIMAAMQRPAAGEMSPDFMAALEATDGK